MDEIQDYYDRKARHAHLAGFATVDELRTAYEQLRERNHALRDRYEALADAARDALPYLWQEGTTIVDGVRTLEDDNTAADTWTALVDALGCEE